MTELEEVDGGGSGGGAGEAALLALEGEPPLSTKAPLSEGSGERGGKERCKCARPHSRPDGKHKQYGLTDYTTELEQKGGLRLWHSGARVRFALLVKAERAERQIQNVEK